MERTCYIRTLVHVQATISNIAVDHDWLGPAPSLRPHGWLRPPANMPMATETVAQGKIGVPSRTHIRQISCHPEILARRSASRPVCPPCPLLVRAWSTDPFEPRWWGIMSWMCHRHI